MRIPKFRITLRLLMIGMAIVAFLLLLITRTRPHRRDVRKKAEARYTAAAQTYKEAERLFVLARIEFNDVYFYSRMLLEAQRDIGDSAAAADHLKRMQMIQKLIRSRYEYI